MMPKMTGYLRRIVSTSSTAETSSLRSRDWPKLIDQAYEYDTQRVPLEHSFPVAPCLPCSLVSRKTLKPGGYRCSYPVPKSDDNTLHLLTSYALIANYYFQIGDAIGADGHSPLHYERQCSQSFNPFNLTLEID